MEKEKSADNPGKEHEALRSEGSRILIADDQEANLLVLESMLRAFEYDVALARNGKEALDRVEESPFDLILLDIMMPVMDGFQVLNHLKANNRTRLIPVVMVTALEDLESRVKALEYGADDFLNKPIEKSELCARVRSLLKVKAYNDHMIEYQETLEIEVENKTRELRKALELIRGASLDTIFRLSHAAEFREKETGNHIYRVSNYSAAIAKSMGLNQQALESIMYSSAMHDLGKIGIPDQILLKPDRLNEGEWKIMREHSMIGARILEGSEFEYIKAARMIALTHHEKWDGTGYPHNLRGEEIPVEGRITALADVFDALLSKRPYKKAYSLEKTFEIIRSLSGTQFDPVVVDTFFRIKDEILQIREMFRDQDGWGRGWACGRTE